MVPATPDVDIGEVCSNLTSAPQLVESLSPIRQSFCPNLPICAPRVWLQTGKWVQLAGFGCLCRRRGEERDEQDRDMKWTWATDELGLCPLPACIKTSEEARFKRHQNIYLYNSDTNMIWFVDTISIRNWCDFRYTIQCLNSRSHGQTRIKIVSTNSIKTPWN